MTANEVRQFRDRLNQVIYAPPKGVDLTGIYEAYVTLGRLEHQLPSDAEECYAPV